MVKGTDSALKSVPGTETVTGVEGGGSLACEAFCLDCVHKLVRLFKEESK